MAGRIVCSVFGQAFFFCWGLLYRVWNISTEGDKCVGYNKVIGVGVQVWERRFCGLRKIGTIIYVLKFIKKHDTGL